MVNQKELSVPSYLFKVTLAFEVVRKNKYQLRIYNEVVEVLKIELL